LSDRRCYRNDETFAFDVEVFKLNIYTLRFQIIAILSQSEQRERERERGVRQRERAGGRGRERERFAT
jgi:hypothetical protein